MRGSGVLPATLAMTEKEALECATDGKAHGAAKARTGKCAVRHGAVPGREWAGELPGA